MDLIKSFEGWRSNANGDVFWLRSPTISASLGAGNCTFYEGRDITGTTTTLDFYVDVQ